jgi:uncharacterized protein YegL
MSPHEEGETEGIGGVRPKNISRVPTLLLLDTSHSMSLDATDEDGNTRDRINIVNEGLELFKQEIGEDYKTEKAVDISLVTFGGDVSTEQEFVEIADWSPEELNASGGTPLCEAMVRGANHLEDFRHQLEDNRVPKKKALVWLLTDGEPTDENQYWDEAQKVVKDGTESGDVLFYGVGIGEEANTDKLEELFSAAPDQSKVDVFPLKDGMFKEFFRIVSESVQTHSEEGTDSADENGPTEQQ